MQAIRDEAGLLAHDPQWVAFWAGHVRPGQFAIWAPYLRRSRYRTLVARNGRVPIDDGVLAAVEPMPRAAVALVEPFDELVAWLARLPDLRGFLYVGSYRQNAELMVRLCVVRVVRKHPAPEHLRIGRPAHALALGCGIHHLLESQSGHESASC